jgi:hypothetical protein
MTILFADGNAEFFPAAQAVEILQRANHPTSQPAPF